MPKNGQSRSKSAPNTFEPEIKALGQLPDLSPMVQAILKSWLTMHKYLARKTTHSGKRFPVFRVLNQEDIRLLQTLRQQLIEQFQDDPEFQEATAYTMGSDFDRKVFQSIRLYGASKGHNILFPRTPFYEIRLGNPERLLEMIIEHLTKFSHYRTLSNFIDLLVVARARTPVRRTALAVRYFQALVDLGFVTALHQTITDTDLAKVLRCSEESAHQIHNVYKHLGAVNTQYMVNLSKLGFHCVRVVHQAPLPADFHPFTLRTYLLDRTTFLSILWLPSTSDLLSRLPAAQTMAITQYLIARNFSQLHRTPANSWPYPNRLLEETAPIMPPQRGIWFTLTPNPDPPPRPLLDFSLLDQLQFSGPEVYAKLADSLEVSEKYVRKRLEALLQDGVIAPFYFATRIGLNVTLLVAFEGPATETAALRQDLLAFPYCELFAGPQGGHALLKIPEFWTPTVLEDVLRLRRKGKEIWAVYSSPVISRWGIPLTTIVQKNDFFGIMAKTGGSSSE
jgi:hypothetical protein